MYPSLLFLLCTIGNVVTSYDNYNVCYEEKNALHLELSKERERVRVLENDVNLWKSACKIQEDNEKEDILRRDSEINALRIKSYGMDVFYAKMLNEKSDTIISINKTALGLQANLSECLTELNKSRIVSDDKAEVIEDIEEENTGLLKTVEGYKIRHHRCRQRNRKRSNMLKKCKQNSKNEMNNLIAKVKEEFQIFINSSLAYINETIN